MAALTQSISTPVRPPGSLSFSLRNKRVVTDVDSDRRGCVTASSKDPGLGIDAIDGVVGNGDPGLLPTPHKPAGGPSPTSQKYIPAKFPEEDTGSGRYGASTLNVLEALDLLFPDDDTARPTARVAPVRYLGSHDDPLIDGTPLTTTELADHLHLKRRWDDLPAIVESFARLGPTPSLAANGDILSQRTVGLHSIVAPGQLVTRGTKPGMPTRLIPRRIDEALPPAGPHLSMQQAYPAEEFLDQGNKDYSESHNPPSSGPQPTDGRQRQVKRDASRGIDESSAKDKRDEEDAACDAGMRNPARVCKRWPALVEAMQPIRRALVLACHTIPDLQSLPLAVGAKPSRGPPSGESVRA